MSTHLYDSDHPYRCETANCWSGGDMHSRFSSWAEFHDDMGDADMDYNLLFRWDWSAESNRLDLFFMQQRKGRFASASINLTPDDEGEVVKWLAERWAHMVEIWSPLPEMLGVGGQVGIEELRRTLRRDRISLLRLQLEVLMEQDRRDDGGGE